MTLYEWGLFLVGAITGYVVGAYLFPMIHP